MAAILISLTLLAAHSVRDARRRRALAKQHHNSSRFDELERDNAARIARLQATTCFCEESDWAGGGCEVHGAHGAHGAHGHGAGGGYGDGEEEERGFMIGGSGAGAGGILEGGDEEGDEVTRMRINEERRRRRRMKSGGFTNWVLRRREGKEKEDKGRKGEVGVVA